MDLLGTPIIAKRKVRGDVYAYLHESGVITIEGTRYFFHTFTSAIREWKKQNPKK